MVQKDILAIVEEHLCLMRGFFGKNMIILWQFSACRLLKRSLSFNTKWLKALEKFCSLNYCLCFPLPWCLNTQPINTQHNDIQNGDIYQGTQLNSLMLQNLNKGPILS